jgi:uncharacterized membrane protein
MIAWTGTIASIIGAFLVALGYMQIGYICFTLGSVSWLYVAHTRRDNSLAVLNGTFLFANLVGLYNNFF